MATPGSDPTAGGAEPVGGDATDPPGSGRSVAQLPGAAPGSSAPTAVGRVYEFVRERVFSGEYADGTMLSEGQIGTALGVSRTPVREAFVQLQAQGFLRLYPKRGALVVPVSREEIDAVIETRWVIERHGLEQLVEHPDPAVTAAMATVCDEQQRLLDAGDLGAFSDVDREFHRTFVAATRNPILLSLYDSLRDRQRRMVGVTVHQDAARAATVLAQHREILAAVEAGKASKAVRLLQAHLELTRTSPALLGRAAAAT